MPFKDNLMEIHIATIKNDLMAHMRKNVQSSQKNLFRQLVSFSDNTIS